MDKAISLELELELDYYCDFWGYYYEDYDSIYWDEEREPCWKYLESSNRYDVVETFRYGKRFKSNVITGRMIDMNTIYSKEKLRERKIDQILGLELPTYIHKPTLGDFFQKNN